MKQSVLNQNNDKKNNLKSCFNDLKNIISQTKNYNPLIRGKQSTSYNSKIPASRVSLLRRTGI